MKTIKNILSLLILTLCGFVQLSHAGDVDVRLTTTDGSTKFTIQDSLSAEVASVNSNGEGIFQSLTQSGSGGNLILSTGTLQSGTTFYVSSGTVAGNLYSNTRAQVGGLLDRNTSDVTVSNTVTETSIYSYVVPAGLLSTNRGIRLRVRGTYTNNSGATKTIRLRLKLGATTILDKTSATNASNATAGDFLAEFFLTNTGSASSQEAAMRFLIDRAGTMISPIIDTGTGAVDTTVAQTMDVTITHSVANASTTLVKQGATTFLE